MNHIIAVFSTILTEEFVEKRETVH